jgi:hypothetical protein
MSGEATWRTGGCHCGAVRYEVLAADQVRATRCNCSMCTKTGYLHLTVDEAEFRITQGREVLTEYRFNTMAAQHLFCSVCGIKSFYRPRSRPDGWSVNINTLDEPEALSYTLTEIDGRNWEAHMAAMSEDERSIV